MGRELHLFQNEAVNLYVLCMGVCIYIYMHSLYIYIYKIQIYLHTSFYKCIALECL